MTRLRRREVHHSDRVVDCFAERPASVQDLFLRSATEAGTGIAVQDGEARLTYSQLAARAARLAKGLADRGVGKGDRVAMLLDNRTEFVEVLVACALIGAVAVPMGTRLRGAEIDHICRDAEPRVLIHERALAEHVPAHLDCYSVSDDEGGGDTGTYAGLLDAGTLDGFTAVDEDDPFCIMYTSGTTGRPKGAILTHLGFVHSCIHWIERLGLTRGVSTALVIPASHVSGLGGVVMPMLALGGRIIMVRAFKAAAFIELLARERVEHALLVPAMYNLCLRSDAFPAADLGAWRWAVYGGAPMPEPTIRRFAEVLPHLSMCNAYGATETTSPVTIMAPGVGVERSDSIGTVVDCGDVRIMDEKGREVPAGEPGELFIAGPMVSPGYWRNEEATRQAFVSGYWRSGDIGSIDGEGYVQIFDRKKDMINRGGYKVYPAEVESALSDHPDIVEAAVVGAPDEVLGEIVVSFVRAGERAVTAEAVRSFCAGRMADYKVPDIVAVLSEPLPRNANGKLQKDTLRKLALEQPRSRKPG